MGIQAGDLLPGCSKLQDLLETVIEHINEHDAAIARLQGRVDTLDPDGAAGADGKGADGKPPLRMQDLSARLLDLEARHADLLEKVGLEHLELEQLASKLDHEDAELAKLAEIARKTEEREHELEAQVRGLSKMHDEEHAHQLEIEAELHSMEDHFKKVDGWEEQEEKVVKSLGNVVKDLTNDVEDIKIKLKAMGGGDKADGELSEELMQAITAVVAPMGAAIDALDAKYEAHVVVRLESHEIRITEQEKLQEQGVQSSSAAERSAQLAQQQNENPAKAAWGDGPEQREAALQQITSAQNSATDALNAVRSEMQDALSHVDAVKEEMGALSGQVSKVVISVSELEAEVRAKGFDPAEPSGQAEMVEATLGKVREQLESRVAALEESLRATGGQGDEQHGDPLQQQEQQQQQQNQQQQQLSPQQLEQLQQQSQQLSARGDAQLKELSDTLHQVEADLRSLDHVATQDMRPKLEKQALEMQRLWQQLRETMERMQKQPMASAGSMLTTKGGPRCLVCYDQRDDPAKKRTTTGRDGHPYFTSPGPTYSPPAESPTMIQALLRPRNLGSGGTSSRKYMLMPDQVTDGAHHGAQRHTSRSTSSIRGSSPAGITSRPQSRGAGSRMVQHMARVQGGVTVPSVAGFYF